MASLLLNMTVSGQSWQWAKSIGGVGYETSGFMCEDNLGNSYVTGSFTNMCYFQTDTFIVNGLNDFFLAKYDNNGNELWVYQIGGPYNLSTQPKMEVAGKISFDSYSNSIIMTGRFVAECIFGTDTLHSTSTNDIDCFVAKFDLSGNCIWAKSFGGSGDEAGSQSTTDSLGNIYISGIIAPPYGIFENDTITYCDFLAKFSPGGNLLWVHNLFNGIISSPGIYSSGGVHSIKYHNDYLFIYAANFEDTLTFAGTLIENPNYYGKILAKFDTSGSLVWFDQFGGPSAIGGPKSMGVDSSGNIYLGGQYQAPFATFNNFQDTIFPTGNSDSYIVKFDNNGNQDWISHTSPTITSDFYNSDVDSDGNIYITGSLNGTASFGSYSISSNTNEDMFLARYNNAGDCLGVLHFGEGIGFDVVHDTDGNAVIAGQFQNSFALGSNTLSSLGGYDILIAKIDQFTGYGEEESSNSSLVIYANPNSGKCNISIPDEFKNERYLELLIFDLSGKLIQQKLVELTGGLIKLNLEAQAVGIYTVSLSNAKKKSYRGKIVLY